MNYFSNRIKNFNFISYSYKYQHDMTFVNGFDSTKNFKYRSINICGRLLYKYQFIFTDNVVYYSL